MVVTSGISGTLNFSGSLFTGNILLVLAAVSMSVYSIYMRSFIKKYGGIRTTFTGMAAGTFFLFIINIFNEEFFREFTLLGRPTILLPVLYLGIVSTAFAYLMFNLSLKHIDVIKATAFKFLTPLSGFILSILFLGEQPSLAVLTGTLIVILSIIFMQWSPVRAKNQ